VIIKSFEIIPNSGNIHIRWHVKEMVRGMTEYNIIQPEEIEYFDHLEYKYCNGLSNTDNLVFINSRR